MLISGKEILFIGHDLSDKGGISTLENSYKRLFEEYKHVAIYKYGTYISKIIVFLKGVCRIIALLYRDKQIKIVHIHTASGIDFYRNVFPIVIASAFNKSIILHIHGGYFSYFYQKNPKMNGFIMKRVRCIIVVSNFLKEEISKLKVELPIHTVYNIVDEADIDRTDIIKPHKKLRLGFLGAINDNKRIFDIVEMFIKHPDLKSICTLSIAGIGDVSRLSELINNNKLNDTIQYVGWVEKWEKAAFFKEIDLLLQPSDFESFGLSIAEALSYGCPVIATRVGGIPEIIENGVNGYLIEPRDFESLYRIILGIHSDRDLLSEMSKISVSSVRKFSRNAIISELNKVYDTLI